MTEPSRVHTKGPVTDSGRDNATMNILISGCSCPCWSTNVRSYRLTEGFCQLCRREFESTPVFDGSSVGPSRSKQLEPTIAILAPS